LVKESHDIPFITFTGPAVKRDLNPKKRDHQQVGDPKMRRTRNEKMATEDRAGLMSAFPPYSA